MKNLIKDLWLVITLITGASALLLLSDLEQRQGADENSGQIQFPSIAVMQVRSTPVLDNHVAGVLARLKELGCVAPDNHNIRLFNPQGDVATANTIAREIANSPYDLVITSSTMSLQIFSKANQSIGKLHVFGAVTDPYGTGVGITGPGADQHPPYLAGVGTFQPVKRAFRIARELYPRIRKIGVVWNPGEQCSEACLNEAREFCGEAGIELVEAIATNTSEVSEAARSLMAKGVEAVWIGGDTVASSAASMIINLARQAGIPVFTNDPADVKIGTIFSLGANYYTVGIYTADIAAAILRGKSPSEFRIENVIPEELRVNQEVLTSFGKWKMNPVVQDILQKQDSVLAKTEVSVPVKNVIRAERNPPYKLRMVLYSETEFAERSREGLLDGIKKAGLVEGKDYELVVYNAQGDMSTLSSIMTAVKSDRADLLMVVSTPALQAALRQAGAETKIVFTGVGDGVRAGAGKSETDHLPNVTGITTRSPFEGMAAIISETLPGIKCVGTLYTPAEINSVLYKDWFKDALQKKGIGLVAVPVTSSADVPQAAIELCRNDIQLVCQVVDNLTRPGFALISRKAAENNLPVFVFDSDQIKDGGTICLSRDYYDAGLEAGEMAVSVLQGKSPALIPFRNTSSEKLIYNPALADKYKLRISDTFSAKAIVLNK
ncbi:MAG: ABC transporter substrate-binding protein [Prolixibacteraceae bacterium]